MVFRIDVTGGSPPLSAVTIASLEDLGYSVNISAADNFDINTQAQRLRGEASSHSVVNLKNDIPAWFDPKKLKKGLPAV